MAVLKDQAKMDSKIITIYIVDNIIPLYIIHREASILSVIESHFVYSTVSVKKLARAKKLARFFTKMVSHEAETFLIFFFTQIIVLHLVFKESF